MKNGKIEFLRFAFCIVIMMFHIGDDILGLDYRIAGDISFFSKGYFAVEFFFVVSGYLMASSAYKCQQNKLGLGRETFGFMKRKVMAVLPYHLLFYVVTFLTVAVLSEFSVSEAAVRLFKSLPNLLLISRSGLPTKDVMGVEWYIADMLIAMLILYPVCRKYYDRFTKVLAPVAAVMIIGYLIKTTGSLSGSTAWSVIVSKTFLRAFSEICAGAFVFELTRNIRKLRFSKVDKLFLSVLELCSYLLVIAFIVMANIPKRFAGHVLIFVCIGVCLSFSGVTYGSKLFNNKLFYFLGSLSLPLYLAQSFARRIASKALGEMDDWNKIAVFFALCFVAVAILYPVEKLLRKAIVRKMDKLGIK
ncbi:MAG: acyltransferase [Ruminococcaceae bacterium]|nr:acyltransferase [Oscillospiraceae bacterium]